MLIILIAILTLIDIICTGIGVSGGYIGEGNPIAATLFGISIPGTCIFIAVVVGLFLWFISKYINKFKWIKIAMIFILIVKIIIVMMHLFWISQVI